MEYGLPSSTIGNHEVLSTYTVWEEGPDNATRVIRHFGTKPAVNTGIVRELPDGSETPAARYLRTCDNVAEEVEIGVTPHSSTNETEEERHVLMVGKPVMQVNPTGLLERYAKREVSTATVEDAMQFVTEQKITIGELAATQEQRNRIACLLFEYQDCFVKTLHDLKATDLVEHRIDTDPAIKPFRLRQVRYTRNEIAFAQKVFPKMEEADIITRGSSTWAAYTRFPYKRSGELRVVHDFRPVNSATYKPQWPTHNRDEDFDALTQGGHGVFFKADASNGYWAVPVRVEDRWKAAVITPHGMYLYNRMAQGLCGAAHTYSQFGDIVFGVHPPSPFQPQGLPSLFGYHQQWGASFAIFVDDHLISAASFDDMYLFLRDHYFPRIAAGPIYMTGKKTVVCVPNMEAIGFEVSAGKTRPNAQHRERFAKWKTQPPEKAEDVEAFLYLTSYLKQYVPGRADRARILKTSYMDHVPRKTPKGKISTQKCWVKKREFEWTAEHQATFDYMCDAVQERSCRGVLPDTQFHLATDASDTGTGGVLIQLPDTPPGTELEDKHMGLMSVIMYISHRLSDTESRYPITEKEALAVLRALAETRWIIISSKYPILIYTDHEALLVLLRAGKELKGRLARWVTQFAEYDILIKHRPGKSKLMGIADGLSRLPTRWQNEVIHEGAEVIDYLPNLNTVSISHGDVLPFADVRVGQPVLSPTTHELLTPWYGDILSFLIDGLNGIKGYSVNRQRWIKRQAIHYVLRGEKLYHVERTGQLSLCIGEPHVALALKWAHDHHGHYADILTLNRLRGKIYWPSRSVDVNTYVMTCLQCQQNGRRPEPLIPRTIMIWTPWQMVGMDFLGPINPPGYNGHKHVMIVVDYCTRYIFTSSSPSASSEHVLNVWNQLHPIFGWPRVVYCDKGSHFTAEAVQSRFTRQGSDVIYAPVTHASSVGLVERMVREVKTMLRKWATGKDPVMIRTWPDRLRGFTSSINTRRPQGQRYSPSEMLLGYQLRHDLPKITDPPGEIHQVDADWDTVAEDAMGSEGQSMRHLETRDEARRQFIQRLIDRERDTGTRHHWSAHMKPRDWVWWYQTHPGKKGDISRKLAPKWTGPWELASQVSDVTWSVTNPTLPNRGAVKAHVNQLKPYLTRPERLNESGPTLTMESEVPFTRIPEPELVGVDHRRLDLMSSDF
ncbi:hypothetical protein ANO14919_056790 [Xylariales sp. No.14919]|nr:hypothetical protein ANO14919_056790 [Xylariales sp. No.14919]